MLATLRFIVLGSLLLSVRTQELEGKSLFNIPLTQCCSGNEFYGLGFDKCKGESIVFEGKWPPPVYIPKTNRTISVGLEGLDVIQNMSDCAEGYIGKSWTDYRFYSDGTLWVPTQGTFQPGEFCLNPIVRDPGGPSSVARACVPDPCRDTACVRKCCPQKMSINETDNLCHSSSLTFNVIPRNESGVPVEPDPSSIIRDGVVPVCPYGFDSLSEEYGDVFYILANGSMFIPSFPKGEQYTDDYCIDNFVQLDGSKFQALTCFPPQPTDPADVVLSLTIFPYFLFISSIFLIATFLVYAIIPEIRNIHGVSIMCHVASLTVMYIGLGIIQLASAMPHGLCIALAIVVHFAFLSTFTWLNVMSFDIWWTFSDLRPRNSRHGRQKLGRRFIFYSIYAWTVPFVIVLVGQILDNVKNLPPNIIKPNFGEFKCWFSSRNSFLAYLYGPVAVLILSNIIFFVMTIVLLYRASVDTAFAASSHQAKQKFRVIFSLFILMGVSWMTEIISYAVGGDAYNWIFTDILNILTGVFIFFIFVCKPNVWKLLKLKCPCMERLDVCCPKFMRTGATRQGTSSRSTRNESTTSKSNHSVHNHHHEDTRKKISVTAVTQSTQLQDPTQIDSADEMMDNDSRLTD